MAQQPLDNEAISNVFNGGELLPEQIRSCVMGSLCMCYAGKRCHVGEKLEGKGYKEAVIDGTIPLCRVFAITPKNLDAVRYSPPKVVGQAKSIPIEKVYEQ